jgi:hypothetical protein
MVKWASLKGQGLRPYQVRGLGQVQAWIDAAYISAEYARQDEEDRAAAAAGDGAQSAISRELFGDDGRDKRLLNAKQAEFIDLFRPRPSYAPGAAEAARYMEPTPVDDDPQFDYKIKAQVRAKAELIADKEVAIWQEARAAFRAEHPALTNPLRLSEPAEAARQPQAQVRRRREAALWRDMLAKRRSAAGK